MNRDLRRKLDLLYLLTRKEVALKYKRTVLGVFWSVLNPLLTATVFFVAFKVFMRFQVDNYAFFLLAALFPWTWFSSCVIISSRALADNVSLIKKVIFPRPYLVVAVLLSQLVNLFAAVPILFGLSVFTMDGPSWTWIWGIPLLALVQLMFTFGITLAVSITNTYFRDVEYLVGVFMNLLFWMTPITYPLDAVPEHIRSILLLNPLSSLMFAWRELFMHNRILWDMVGISLAVSAVVLVVGALIFRALERRLDEVL